MSTLIDFRHEESERNNSFSETAFNLIKNPDNQYYFLILIENYPFELPKEGQNSITICNHYFAFENDKGIEFVKVKLNKATGKTEIETFNEVEFEDEIFTVYMSKKFINKTKMKIRTYRAEQNLINFN
jgi:hypothetical protein